MLRALTIQDMLIIDRLDLDFEPGLNVLTGETGAGKSILLDALGFVLGWRGRADLVRDGAKKGIVEATFVLPPDHPAQAILRDLDIDLDGDDLRLVREITPSGKRTARINGTIANTEQLQTLSATLVELHGQQDDRGLLDPRGHRVILDDFAGSAALLEEVRRSWAALREAHRARLTLQDDLDRLRNRETSLRDDVRRLEAASVSIGEYAELEERRALLRMAEQIYKPVREARDILTGESDGAPKDHDPRKPFARALAMLERIADQASDRLAPAIRALNAVLAEIEEGSEQLRDLLESMEYDDTENDRVISRLKLLTDLTKAYPATTPDDLSAILDAKRAELRALEDSGLDMAGRDRAVTLAEAAYTAAAALLSAHRRAAATRLGQAMAGELAPLKMERATFAVSITPAEPGPDGVDTVTFEAATNPGAPAGALNRIASGGELSRFLLALKVCLTRGTTGLTLIFDEIDRGVGGATADAVGRRLAALSQGAQVLVVTHSPQVAARGQHHWRVEKAVLDDRTLSRVVPLDAAGRIDEIARMLAGDSVTPAARAAALVLLNAG